MRYSTAILVILLSAGCSIQRAQVADQAQHQLVGMSKGQILSCMGAPAGQTAADNVEVWSYPSGGRTDTFAAGQTFASGTGVYNGLTTGPTTTGVYSGSGSATSFGSSTSVNRYCTVSVVFNGDRVSAVNYQGRTGGLITQGEECAYAVQNCVGQPPAPVALSPAAAAPTITAYSAPALPVPTVQPATLADSQAQNAIYRNCTAQKSLGNTPAELDANCTCMAQAAEPTLTPKDRDALAAGTKRPDQMSDAVSLIEVKATMRQCEGVRRILRPFLEQQVQEACSSGQLARAKDCNDGKAFLKEIEN